MLDDLTVQRSRGRPSAYSEKNAAEVCERLAAGESLRAICRDGHMPPESTIRGWAIEDYSGFSARYARARVKSRPSAMLKRYYKSPTPITQALMVQQTMR